MSRVVPQTAGDIPHQAAGKRPDTPPPKPEFPADSKPPADGQTRIYGQTQIYGKARATTAKWTTAAPPRLSTLAASVAVAPVVSTSSTNNNRWPANGW